MVPYINGQPIWENLPARCVDLKNCAVWSWLEVAEDANQSLLADLIEYGTIKVNGQDVAWGKTAKDEKGLFDIVVDSELITVDVLHSLADLIK